MTQIPSSENSANDRDIYEIVEQMPLYPGKDCGDIKNYDQRKSCSDKAMLTYIYDNIRYPKEAKDKGVQGMAVVRFVIEPNGVMSNIEVVRDPGAGLGEAAARVVRNMKEENTRWEPGLQKGKPVRARFNLPIKFKLE